MILGLLDIPDAPVIVQVARESGRMLNDDEERSAIFERFRWFAPGHRRMRCGGDVLDELHGNGPSSGNTRCARR
jgi:hypothetical protein